VTFGPPTSFSKAFSPSFLSGLSTTPFEAKNQLVSLLRTPLIAAPSFFLFFCSAPFFSPLIIEEAAGLKGRRAFSFLLVIGIAFPHLFSPLCCRRSIHFPLWTTSIILFDSFSFFRYDSDGRGTPFSSLRHRFPFGRFLKEPDLICCKTQLSRLGSVGFLRALIHVATPFSPLPPFLFSFSFFLLQNVKKSSMPIIASSPSFVEDDFPHRVDLFFFSSRGKKIPPREE